MVVLDSNVMISIMKWDKNLLDFIKNFNSIAATVINIYEIMRGKYNIAIERFFESNYNLSVNTRPSFNRKSISIGFHKRVYEH